MGSLLARCLRLHVYVNFRVTCNCILTLFFLPKYQVPRPAKHLGPVETVVLQLRLVSRRQCTPSAFSRKIAWGVASTGVSALEFRFGFSEFRYLVGRFFNIFGASALAAWQ